ncbi:PH domain-containing protein [Pedococcus sp. 5OH_020]|uniref:PH domain-containing protein n=1 Tax=Pedococcus sp. 5OH_020 TaxID=2989814 RepID=UPI0022E9ABF7|nr:PH domain-containing protein [Pedococcus sp. 5OH_020]
MDRQARRHAELDRYLLDGERLVTAVHQHWGKVAEPVGSAVAGGIVALWVDAKVGPSFHLVSTVVWWAWFALVLRLLYLLAQWRHDWFVATDKRLLLFYGFITRRVSMMPLTKVTDMSYERSVPGRLTGYGRFVMESAGQDQALRVVNWVPQPDHHYRAICAEIFGVPDRALLVAEEDGWPASVGHGREGSIPSQPSPPDLYAGWNEEDRGPNRAAGSLYRSSDLQARDRSADTGPMPLYPPRDEYDD